MARSKAYLHRGVEIRWNCAPELLGPEDRTPKEATLHFPGGLRDFLQAAMGERPTLVEEPFSGQAEFADGAGRVEWAITWPDDRDDGFTSSYCNTVATPEGGSHEQGLRAALLRAVKARRDDRNRKVAQIRETISWRLLRPALLFIPIHNTRPDQERLASPEAPSWWKRW